MHTGLSALTELAVRLRAVPNPARHWASTTDVFRTWADDATLREDLRGQLSWLASNEASALADKSKETTTHFAYCLLDEPDDEFSLWLHEYKPQRDWRQGYANTVHNHRYHFCTTILTGSYLHQRFGVELDAAGGTVRAARLASSRVCRAGASGRMLANEFHRIPRAEDGTLTFLVKSRTIRRWSVSYDPATRRSRTHLPIRDRLDQLAARL